MHASRTFCVDLYPNSIKVRDTLWGIEIMRGEFQRTLSLPDNVDNEHANASFKDGILKVTIPKTEKNKRKSIEIK